MSVGTQDIVGIWQRYNLYYKYVILVTEIASTLNEQLLARYLLNDIDNTKRRA